jgi:hypothetical protein
MQENLEAAGIEQKVDTLVADSGYLSDDNLLAADDDTADLLIAAANDRDQRIDRKPPRGRIPKKLSPTNEWRASLRPNEDRTSTQSAPRWSSQCSRTARPEAAGDSCGEDGPRATASGSSRTRPTTSSSCGVRGGMDDSIKQRCHAE